MSTTPSVPSSIMETESGLPATLPPAPAAAPNAPAAPGLPDAPAAMAAPVQSIPLDKKERIMALLQGRVLNAATGAPSDKLSDTIQKHYEQRLAEARMYKQNAQLYASILATGRDPKTGQPLTPEQEAEYEAQYNASMGQYQKSAGVDKASKDHVNKAKAFVDHVIAMGRQHRAQAGGQTAGGQGASATPTTAAGVSVSAPGAAAPSATFGTPGHNDVATTPAQIEAAMTPEERARMRGGLPPAPTPQAAAPSASAPQASARDALAAPALAADFQADQARQNKTRDSEAAFASKYAEAKKLGLREGSREFFEFMTGGKISAQHLQQANFRTPDGKTMSGSYDPDEGVFLDQKGNVVPDAIKITTSADAPKPWTYVGPDGKPHPGWKTLDGLFDAEMNPLPPDTQAFSAWMQPQQTVTKGVKMVPQPDGTTVAVPVTTESTRTRGATGASAEPSASGGTGKGASSKAGASSGGKVVGGKVPSGVAKAYENYNAAQERYAVMQDALPRAQSGDQQAAVNLLANHIGMTMGLQKGARITQSIYDEAAQSAPWLARVGARFGSDGYLSGVVLTPEQMTQMIELAKVRLDQDRQTWLREVDAAKTGYGMTKKPGKLPDAPDVAPPRPSKVPANYIFMENGPHGRGWYKPSAAGNQ